MNDCSRWERGFVSVPASVKQARDWLDALLAEAGVCEERAAAAVLLLSELASAAVAAQRPRGGSFHAAALLEARRIRIEVAHARAHLPPGSSGVWASGWSWALVRHFAVRHGHTGEGPTRVLFAEITRALDPDPPLPSRRARPTPRGGAPASSRRVLDLVRWEPTAPGAASLN